MDETRGEEALTAGAAGRTSMAATVAELEALAARAGIAPEHAVPYGRDVAKIELSALATVGAPTALGDPRTPGEPSAPAKGAHCVVVTAMSPTPFGEGKSTVAIGLAQALARRQRRAVLTLRQSAMGPTFGIKGGAGGAGGARIHPADRMNLHLTGDFHAVTAAHNLLAALIDNHLHQGNALRIDERSLTWPRVLDVNDRALRHIVTGLGSRVDGVTRQSSFDITPRQRGHGHPLARHIARRPARAARQDRRRPRPRRRLGDRRGPRRGRRHDRHPA